MYLVLRPPWAGGASLPDAGVVAQAPIDAAVGKPKKSTKRPHHTGTGGRTSAGPDFEPGTDDPDDKPAPTIVLSAADRALEWRGDATAIARKIDMNAPGDARPLDAGEINSTVGSQSGSVRG